MTFLETPRFSDRLARNLKMRTQRKSTVTPLVSGFEQRNEEWSQSRLTADAATAVRTLTDFQEILDWFAICGGRAHAFRVRDWSDYQVTVASGQLQPVTAQGLDIGTGGAGYGMPSHQLVRYRARGALVHRRRIRKPVSGDVAVFRAGNPVTIGAGAGQISIDTTTGLVLFVADGTGNVTNVAVGTTTVLTVSATPAGLIVSERVYVSGLAGADAGLLNDQSHPVTNIGGGAITISSNTAGKTITAGSGVVARYPQASETLTWSGTFDVPMRFDSDEPEYEVLGRAGGGEILVRATAMPLIEVRT